jgi:hypothetical protein
MTSRHNPKILDSSLRGNDGFVGTVAQEYECCSWAPSVRWQRILISETEACSRNEQHARQTHNVVENEDRSFLLYKPTTEVPEVQRLHPVVCSVTGSSPPASDRPDREREMGP